MSAVYPVTIKPEMAEALIVAAERRRLRNVGQIVGGPRLHCGCGASYSLHDGICQHCNKDTTFAQALYPSSFPIGGQR